MISILLFQLSFNLECAIHPNLVITYWDEFQHPIFLNGFGK